MSQQTTFGDFVPTGKITEGREVGRPEEQPTGNRASKAYLRRAGKARERHPTLPGDDRVCPWCLAGSSCFREPRGDLGEVACGNCEAIVPVNADWYKAGKTIL